jgi:hypothetical protein
MKMQLFGSRTPEHSRPHLQVVDASFVPRQRDPRASGGFLQAENGSPEYTLPLDPFTDTRDIIPSDEPTVHADGIEISNAVTNKWGILLDQFDLDPIRNRTVQGIGKICLQDIRFSVDPANSKPTYRIHRLYTIERYGYEHAIEITDPAHNKPIDTVVSFPAYTECIRSLVRQTFHNETAHRKNQSRVISIGSNGIGVFGDRYAWNERSLHGIKPMAAQRHELTRALVEQGEEVTTIGTSMGTVIDHNVTMMNLWVPKSERINIKERKSLSPALVDPTVALRDMTFRFAVQMGIDTIKEVTKRTPKEELLYIAAAVYHYGLRPRDVPALLNQGIDLLQGTPQEETKLAVEHIPTRMVAGEKDCLAQWPMWSRIKAAHPDNLSLEMIMGRGHILPLKPQKAVAKLFNTATIT